METITLIIMVFGLLIVFAVDAVQKRRAFIAKRKNDR
jgi:hypothetical protein